MKNVLIDIKDCENNSTQECKVDFLTKITTKINIQIDKIYTYFIIACINL